MSKLIVVFAEEFHLDLADRPGRNKLEKEQTAKHRIAMQVVLERLCRELKKGAGTPHLKADVFEPITTLRMYAPESLATLLSNFRLLHRVPEDSAFSSTQLEGYFVTFEYSGLQLSLLAAYLELDAQPVLVFVKALPTLALKTLFNGIKAKVPEHDTYFQMAYEAAMHALDKSPPET